MKTLDEIDELRHTTMTIHAGGLNGQPVDYFYWIGYTAGAYPVVIDTEIRQAVMNCDKDQVDAFYMGERDALGDAKINLTTF